MRRRGTRDVVDLVVCIARRPSLWGTAVRQLVRLIPSGWWHRWPFLPVPARPYLEFRSVTQYGSGDHPLEPDDVLNYLAWCKLVHH